MSGDLKIYRLSQLTITVFCTFQHTDRYKYDIMRGFFLFGSVRHNYLCEMWGFGKPGGIVGWQDLTRHRYSYNALVTCYNHNVKFYIDFPLEKITAPHHRTEFDKVGLMMLSILKLGEPVPNYEISDHQLKHFWI
ncbi:hypothetical protein RF11_00776 [Thelohanellus kitauei]|uniref:Uncharacterized protein n=1 Tax=Thelohanellus kitauei TaxID=669202 RepID=A0A0C2MVG2_THEKT|nr:hypothetical protein RF11_00776 [Thelohanellus kitauei]